jgi:C4-dicarboxylate-binding protein DctP
MFLPMMEHDIGEDELVTEETVITARWSCLTLAWLLLLSFDAHAQQIKLRAALQVPTSELFIGLSLVRLTEEVEKRTGKAISFEILDNGKPYADDQIVGAVASGAIEMGVAGYNQFSDKLPAIGIFEQPFLFNFEALLRAAVSPGSEMRRLVDKTVLEKLGVRVLWWQPLGNQVVFSKGGNVTGPHSIKDQRMRVFSGMMAQFATLCGGKPIILTSGQIHGAFKDNRIDMAMAAISTVRNRELWKVSDNITRTAHSPVEYLLIINEKTWQSLTETHRTIMEEAARSTELWVIDHAAKVEAGNYALAREKEMKIHELTPDHVADWRACSSALVDQYMEVSGDLGRQLMSAYGKLRTDECCSSAPGTATFTRR